MSEKAVILLSGGMDSQVLLASMLEPPRDYETIHAVFANYRQKHRSQEEAASASIAKDMGISWHLLPLPQLHGSALTGYGDIPKNIDYRDPRQSATVVPGRNAVLLSCAVSHAIHFGANTVLFAGHAGDFAVYPDCRPDFINHLSMAFMKGYGVSVRAPFLGMTKKDIAVLGKALKVDFSKSWTCYSPVKTGDGAQESWTPCKECGSCVERAEALEGI